MFPEQIMCYVKLTNGRSDMRNDDIG